MGGVYKILVYSLFSVYGKNIPIAKLNGKIVCKQKHRFKTHTYFVSYIWFQVKGFNSERISMKFPYEIYVKIVMY